MKCIISSFIKLLCFLLLTFFSLQINAQSLQLSESVIGTYHSFSTDGRIYQSLTGGIPVISFSNGSILKLSVLSTDGHIVSVSDPITDAAPMVYPNPTEGFLNISAASSSDTYDLMIFSVYGSFLASRQINGGPIDISGLASGAYILQLRDQHGNAWQYRIIKI